MISPRRSLTVAIGLICLAAAVVSSAQRPDVSAGAQGAMNIPPHAQDRSGEQSDRSVGNQDRSWPGSERATRTRQDAVPRERSSAQESRQYLQRPESPLKRALQLIEANPQLLELVDRFAAVRHELVSIDPSAAALRVLAKRGYRVLADETIEGIETRYVTLRVPDGKSVPAALAEVSRLAPGTQFSANQLYVQSGLAEIGRRSSGKLAALTPINGPAIGIVDGGVADTGLLQTVYQQGFAAGAPRPSSHGTAVASLVAGAGKLKSAAPGAPLLIADIYGSDPKGGNSLALARALGWMTKRTVPVALVGLVGPSNPIVATAVRRAQAEGVTVVAPVGNAGAAMPPMFPAAYPGVIAVTGVDRRNRALIEAGRGSHIDYAAPGADIRAAAQGGAIIKVRGTSFAAPLVAGRLWLARRSPNPILVLDSEAIDLGSKGPDSTFGRGLVCGHCR